MRAARWCASQPRPTGGIAFLPFSSSRTSLCALGERRVALERGPDQAFTVRARDTARTLPGRSAGRGRCRPSPLKDPGDVVRGRHDPRLREHERVLDAAELGALALVEPGARRSLELEVVHLARDRVHLPGERGHPPAVDDVVHGSGDLQVDRPARRQAELVHRHRAVRVGVEPVELAALDLYGHLPGARGGRLAGRP